MIVLNDIRTRLIAAIKQSGLTQTELAKQLNVSQQAIAQYLSGRNMPALDTFANMCVILDVEPAEILGTNGEHPHNVQNSHGEEGKKGKF